MPKQPKKNEYKKFFHEIRQRAEQAKVQAARGVNAELIRLYYHIGESIARNFLPAVDGCKYTLHAHNEISRKEIK